MQFFIHCNFFCQEYKFTFTLLTWERQSHEINKDDSVVFIITTKTSINVAYHLPTEMEFS